MIPRSHPLASVREAFNAVFVESEAAGQLMFYGPGAGGAPDRERGARRPGHGRPQPARPATRGAGESAYADRAVLPMGETRHPLPRRHRRRRPRRACWPRSPTAFAEHGVSIQTVRQEGRGDDAQLVVVTHTAHRRRSWPRPSTRLRGMDIVREVTSVMRVEGDDE